MLSANCFADRFDDAVAAYSNGNYALAIQIWSELANQGDTLSQFNLGILYEQGLGVEQDVLRAVGFYTLAASADYAEAQINLANILYSWTNDSPQNIEHAIYWWNQAAQSGNAEAQYRLGSLLLAGKKIPLNFESAKVWLEKAALQGHQQAKGLLAEVDLNTDFFTPRENWIKEQDPEAYTVVLFTAESLGTVIDFIKQINLSDFAIFKSPFGSHNVISGVFLTEENAINAITNLPAPVKRYHPFVQKFELIQNEIDFVYEEQLPEASLPQIVKNQPAHNLILPIDLQQAQKANAVQEALEAQLALESNVAKKAQAAEKARQTKLLKETLDAQKALTAQQEALAAQQAQAQQEALAIQQTQAQQKH